MFYSHQLLARNTPLGQIWMAATMHAKINRRKLDKLDIIQICEEILNPSAPMALRLSGILMGGVVIVYERKVKLLYEDVSRCMVEINEVWRVKAGSDPTIVPKSKARPRIEKAMLPEELATEMEEKQERQLSDSSLKKSARFKRMRLDDMDEHYIDINLRDDGNQQHHQTEAVNITLFDDYVSSQANTGHFNRFERFDIVDNDETRIKFTSPYQPQAPANLRLSPQDAPEPPHACDTAFPSPPPIARTARDAAIEVNLMDEKVQKLMATEARRVQPLKRKLSACLNDLIMDSEMVIPGSAYQSWLHDASDIVSKRGRTVKECLLSGDPLRSATMSELMDLPPVALIIGADKFQRVRYPAPLMELWRECAVTKSFSGDQAVPEQQPEVKPPERYGGLVEPNPFKSSVENLRANLKDTGFQGNDIFSSDESVAPESPGQCSRSIPSSGSGNLFMPDILLPDEQPTSVRPKRRQRPSSKGDLDQLEEELPSEGKTKSSKLRKSVSVELTSDYELLEETSPTQTQKPFSADPITDRITQSIRSYLKLHFSAPGVPPVESLHKLASGLNQKRAAQLFYQTCVLATLSFIRVQQAEAYVDISILPGPNM